MASELFNRRDVLAYFIVAAIGATVQLLAGSLLQEWFRVSYREALFIGYIVAFLVGFVLTKLFAFNARNSAQTQREAIKFTMVSIVSCLITVYGASWLYDFSVSRAEPFTLLIPFSVKAVNLNKLGSQVFGMGLSFISNYILHKRFTFRDTGFYDKLKALLNL
ncbi:putative flippase GtrA [Spirosoma lacussanchae]|uniref:GtrA family protein n=1 Tax=Spirosoma sordidisoli TaxID=2502893 RepID=A0A4Q2UGY5_9BACT|nr:MULTISPECIES: GtrA family protein [Spirosoma]RYC68286.1 GtrA family protein [Spirosoma sordidisoli]